MAGTYLIISVYSISQSPPNKGIFTGIFRFLASVAKTFGDHAKARQTNQMCHNAWEW